MSDESNKSASACAVCGKAVETHRYAQIIPLRKARESEQADVEIENDDGPVKLKLPKPDETHRLEGKRFVCLSHDPFESVKAMELVGEYVYELRHRPHSQTMTAPISELDSYDVADKTGILTNGRRIQLVGVHGGIATVDCGVLMIMRVYGKDVGPVLAKWQEHLVMQFLEA